MRVAILWTKLSGYINSCLRTLAESEDIELFIAYQAATSDAPFAEQQFQWIPKSYRYEQAPRQNKLLGMLHDFDPQLMLISSWHNPVYRSACREFRDRAVRVCCFDNPWEGTAKQWLGAFTAPVFVQKLFDAAFVPGERQAMLAKKLGFHQDRIWRGLLSCNHAHFSAVYEKRLKQAALPECFLYLGRLSAEKGMDTLCEAYRLYSSRQPQAWPLVVAGEGPLRTDLERLPGVRMLGFIQPAQAPETLLDAGCLVMPSHWDHWCIAIHEACAAGVPVICTDVCGASVHLVRDGYNGLVANTSDPQSLAQALERFSRLSAARRMSMGTASHLLSMQFTPELWSSCVRERGLEMIGQMHTRGQR